MNQPALFLAAAAALAIAAGSVQAKDYSLGALTIEQPWARASVAANGAAYMTISNSGTAADQLTAASSPVATTVELHTHLIEGDVMRMRPVTAIEVNVGEPAVLRPGGLHVMLIGLKGPLKQGETFPLTLTFAKAGSVTVDVEVKAAGAAGKPAMGGHQH